MNNPPRCLLVEDDPDIASMIEMAFREYGIPIEIITHDFDIVCHTPRWKNIDVGIIDVLLGKPYSGADIMRWMKNWVPEVKRVSYSAIITDLPELKELADAVVLKGPLRNLLDALAELQPDGKLITR